MESILYDGAMTGVMSAPGSDPVSPRATRAMLVVILAFYAIVIAVLVVTLATSNAGLQMRMAGFGAGAMYAVCVWHSAEVRGAGRTFTLFALTAVLAFAAEALGDNYGWIFGNYHYTDALGPRLLGVPVLILFTWGTIVYCAFELVTWLSDRGSAPPSGTGVRVVRALLVGLGTGLMAAGFDLMADPLAVSGVWHDVLGADAWWWWVDGGPYLPNLESWQGGDGIPITNFVGWVLVPMTVITVFCLVFPDRDRRDTRTSHAVPLLIYGLLYLTMLGGLVEMAWYDPGLIAAILIGSFTMGPVMVLGALALLQERATGDVGHTAHPADQAATQ